MNQVGNQDIDYYDQKLKGKMNVVFKTIEWTVYRFLVLEKRVVSYG